MSQVSFQAGVDIGYYLGEVGTGYYLNAVGEPSGVWMGIAAGGLGLRGQVNPQVMRALYDHGISPDGEVLSKAQKVPAYDARSLDARTQAAIDDRVKELGKYVTAEDIARMTRASLPFTGG